MNLLLVILQNCGFSGQYLELPSRDGLFSDNPKKRDAEALVVRAGCTLVARTEPAGFRGYSIALAAEKNENLIIDDLDDDHEELEEEIEAVHCYCNSGPKTPKVTKSQSLGSAVLGAFGGKNFRKCNDFVGLFDRYATTLIKYKYCEVILSHSVTG